MNLRDAFKMTCAEIMAGNATILKGPPGFGKSDLMGRVAGWYKPYMQGTLGGGVSNGKKVGISTFFMATQSPIGFTGLPWKGTREVDWNGVKHTYTVTDPAIPQWYMATDLDTGEVRPANLFDGVILVIEEWGQGDAETKRAGAEVLRAGGTPPFYLPPGSPRIALTNVDARDGVTKEFDFIIGRRAEYTIQGDVNVWIEDFADKPYQWQGRMWEVMGVTKAWAKQHPDVLFENKPEKQGPWCNPRTLTSADRFTQILRDQNNGQVPVNDSNFMEGIAGKIGMAAATSFIGHLQFQLELPHYEDVVKDPAGTPIPQKADLLMLMAYELAGRTQKQHLPQIIQYVSRMPKDMAVTYVSSLLRKDYKSIISEPAMQAWISKNAAMMSVIAAISQ